MSSDTAFPMTVADYADEQDRTVADIIEILAFIYPNRPNWRPHDLLHTDNVDDLDHELTEEN